MSVNLKTWQIKYIKNIQYEIVACNNVFALGNDCLMSKCESVGARRLVVLDSALCSNYSKKIEEYFNFRNVVVKIIPFTAGEKNKSIENYIELLLEADNFVVKRKNEPIIAIGGGTLTDVVGFVASSYRRGIAHIKIPTTLMGYVDAAIGIKAGINFNGNKNRIGAFVAPQKVILDKTFFITQERRQILNGACEIVKLAIISDVKLFELLEEHGVKSINSKFQDNRSDLILSNAVNGMLVELETNLFEDNLGRAVDFGHTFSPMLEMTCHDLLHGEAVIIDIIFSIFLANSRKILSKTDLVRILQLIIKLELLDFVFNSTQIYQNVNWLQELLWSSVVERTVHRDGQKIPLPTEIGKCIFINDITIHELGVVCLKFNEFVKESSYFCDPCYLV